MSAQGCVPGYAGDYFHYPMHYPPAVYPNQHPTYQGSTSFTPYPLTEERIREIFREELKLALEKFDVR